MAMRERLKTTCKQHRSDHSQPCTTLRHSFNSDVKIEFISSGPLFTLQRPTRNAAILHHRCDFMCKSSGCRSTELQPYTFKTESVRSHLQQVVHMLSHHPLQIPSPWRWIAGQVSTSSTAHGPRNRMPGGRETAENDADCASMVQVVSTVALWLFVSK